MTRTELEEALKVSDILREAEALMHLEDKARKIDLLNPDFEEIDEFVDMTCPALPCFRKERFRDFSEVLKWRIQTFAGLIGNIPDEFSYAFGLPPPQGTEVAYNPYSLQFTMNDKGFRGLCETLDIKKGYASGTGLCVASSDLTAVARKEIGSSVMLVKRNGFAPDGSAKHGIKAVNSVIEHHERHHAYQNNMGLAGYPPSNTTDRDLLVEEAAQCIAEGSHMNGRHPLLHTNFYVEHDVPEGDFVRLAYVLTPSDHAAARYLIEQRKRVAEALQRTYEKMDKTVAGWALDLLDFRTADRDLALMPAVYQAM